MNKELELIVQAINKLQDINENLHNDLQALEEMRKRIKTSVDQCGALSLTLQALVYEYANHGAVKA